jgi:colanic acid/amylovoran biosynthesis glycosyltransferase
MNHQLIMICAHYISNFLFTTLNWLYPILKSTAGYKPIVFARKINNLESFPVQKLYALARMNLFAQGMNLAFYKTLGYFPLFCKAGRSEGAQLLHAHFGYDGYKMLPLKRKLGVPMITGFYGLDASSYLRRTDWLEKYRRLFEEGEVFLVLGPRMRDALTNAGCPAEKINIQNLGIVVEDFPFQTRNLNPGEVAQIIMGASFREKKGIRYALEAAAILRRHSMQFKLIIAGDGDMRPEIERKISDLDLRRHVELLGYVEPLAFRKLLARAHILILPSVTASDGDMEGTPFVLMEALALGMPVVSTWHADIPEIVKDGHNGFLVPERDAYALAERLEHLLQHPETWEAIGKAGHQHISENFNAEQQFERLLQLYARVIDRSA